MKTIEQLEAEPIVGSFISDEALWVACEDYILDATHTVDDRLRALDVIDRIVGEPSDDVTRDAAGLQRLCSEIKALRE